MAKLDYAQAGVDRDAADRLVKRISEMTRSTLNKNVKASVGGYASLYELDSKRWLAASTDGVGTKLKLAFHLNEHRTVGIDLVAMSVNDLLCVGATPLFFLDYFATSKLNLAVAEQVIQGIVEGCNQSGCALVGGETAEMPDLYSAGEYDLAGFAVGTLSPKKALPIKDIRSGDILIGIGSSGCHSNGYSLLRKLLEKETNEPHIYEQRARELLTPTKIYAKSLADLIEDQAIKGLAHITGSGFLNIPRISEQVSYEIQMPPAQEVPKIYNWVREKSGLSLDELCQTFNMGIGMVAVVNAKKASAVMTHLRKVGEKVWQIGEVVTRVSGKGSQLFVREDAGPSLTLDY